MLSALRCCDGAAAGQPIGNSIEQWVFQHSIATRHRTYGLLKCNVMQAGIKMTLLEAGENIGRGALQAGSQSRPLARTPVGLQGVGIEGMMWLPSGGNHATSCIGGQWQGKGKSMATKSSCSSSPARAACSAWKPRSQTVGMLLPLVCSAMQRKHLDASSSSLAWV